MTTPLTVLFSALRASGLIRAWDGPARSSPPLLRGQALARTCSGCERLLAPLAALPCRCQQAHAEHLLRGAQVVNAAGDRPPAIAGFLEERKSAQPLVLRERRDVAIEAAADDVEAEERQPVLEPVKRNEVAVPRRRGAA